VGWTVLYIAALVFASATMWLLSRRSELKRMAQTLADIEDAKARGSDKAAPVSPGGSGEMHWLRHLHRCLP